MNTRKPTARRKGQSTVEMAVLLVVLVPTFLYVMTADDLLRYRLNLQEVVVASPWDYTHLEYEPGSVAGNALVTNLQQTYRNINNTYSTHDASTEERTAPMTFAGWNVNGSQQVNCDKQQNFATNYSSAPISALVGQVDHGGLYRCNAALAVRNVRLVNRFMQDWAGNENTVTQGAVDTTGIWRLNQQRSSVVTGTWAMTRVDNVNPETHSGVLYTRVNTAYSNTTGSMMASTRARQFVTSDVNNILSMPITIDGMGDDTSTPEVGFSRSARPTVNFSNNAPFDSSPWRSRGAGGNTHEQAYNERKITYMGRDLN